MLSFLSGVFGSRPDFKGLLAQGAIVIDVRTPHEYDAGHVKGSLNFPLDQLGLKLDELKKKNKQVIDVCRSGARSGMAVDTLKKAGINAYNGGGWTSFQQAIS